MKKLVLFSLILSASILFSCDDGAERPKAEVRLGSEPGISLKDANIFLVWDGTHKEVYKYRYYVISDGVLVSGDGNSFSDFEGASYIITIELAQLTESSFTTGSFPVYYDWDLAVESNSDISAVYFYNNPADDQQYYFTADEVGNHEPVVVTDGLDPDQNIKIKFRGKVTGASVTEADLEFYVTGKVIDARREN